MREIISEREGHFFGVALEMHIRDPPLEGTLEWQKPAPHNFIYCACSSVKREPRCYIRAPPSVAIFQQVMGP